MLLLVFIINEKHICLVTCYIAYYIRSASEAPIVAYSVMFHEMLYVHKNICRIFTV